MSILGFELNHSEIREELASRSACLTLLLSCNNLFLNEFVSARQGEGGEKKTAYVGSTATAPIYKKPPATNGIT